MEKTMAIRKIIIISTIIILSSLAFMLFIYGYNHISETDRPRIIQKKDLYTHSFTEFDKQLIIEAEARLTPNYNVVYAYEETPISLTLTFFECGECPELENGLTFWFYYEKIGGSEYYEKINASGGGGSIVSIYPDNFYAINIKPNETKTFDGWVQFTGDGIFRHVLYNRTYHIKLEVDVEDRYSRVVPVDESHIAKQIRSSIVIESFSAITVGVSCIMLIFICFQLYSNIENRLEREKELKELLSKLDEMKPVIRKHGRICTHVLRFTNFITRK